MVILQLRREGSLGIAVVSEKKRIKNVNSFQLISTLLNINLIFGQAVLLGSTEEK
jgi:hypothetical protein